MTTDKFYHTIYVIRHKESGEVFRTDNLNQFCKEMGIGYANCMKMVKGTGYYHSVSGYELVGKQERA